MGSWAWIPSSRRASASGASGDAVTLPSPLRPGGAFNARRPTPAEEEVEPPSERTARLIALPIALLLGVLFARSGLGHALQRIFFGMVLHECGHALAAVLLGFPAFPLLWFTPVAEQRSTLLVLLLLGAGITVATFGWRAERRGWMAAGGALAIVGVGGALLPLQQARALIVFGGDAGALVLGTALMATFFAPEDSVFRRGGVRWGLLVIGAAAYCDAAATWFAARRDPGEIPFGRDRGRGALQSQRPGRGSRLERAGPGLALRHTRRPVPSGTGGALGLARSPSLARRATRRIGSPAVRPGQSKEP